MIKRKTKVFLGPVEVANIANSFLVGLRKAGIKSDFFSFSNSEKFFSYKSGKNIPQYTSEFRLFGKKPASIINLFIRYFFLLYTILRYNTFIFISPHTILNDNSDLKILKTLNKKIVFIFVGCVDRDVDFLKEEPEYICNRCTDEAKQKFCLCDRTEKKSERIRNLERYSNYIVAQEDSAGYLRNQEPVWFHLLVESPKEMDYLNKYNSAIVKIVHIPSNPKIKRSHIIIPILKELQKEGYDVEIVIKSKIQHQEVIKELETAHIVVDALGLSYGVLAVEAMARGCVVMAGDFDFVKKQIPDLPVVGVRSNNLKSKLIKLIENKDLLLNTAKQSIAFYQKYHTLEVGGKYYKEKLDL